MRPLSPPSRRLTAAALFFLGGCAETSWTTRIPTTAAPSPAAATTPTTSVVRSLREDPPLPGESTEGWSGLGEAPRRTTTTLDADEAVGLALDHDRELRARTAELGITHGLARQASVGANPSLEFEVLPERETRFEFGLAYDLSDRIVGRARAHALRGELAAERIEVAAYAIELGFAVRVAHADLLAAQDSLAIAQRSLDAMAAARDAAVALHDAGNLTARQRVATEVAYELARTETASRELAVARAREALVRRLGLSGPDAAIEAVGDARPRDLAATSEGLESAAIEASLELAAARLHLDALDRRAGAARLDGRLPELELDLHVLQGRPDGGSDGNARVGVGAGLTIGLPLADRRQGERAAIAAERDAAIARYDGDAIAIRSSARDARARLESALARLESLETAVVPLQARVLDETRRQYDAMQIDVFVLLATHRTSFDVALATVAAHRELAVARAVVDALRAGVRLRADAPTSPTLGRAAADTDGDHG